MKFSIVDYDLAIRWITIWPRCFHTVLLCVIFQ